MIDIPCVIFAGGKSSRMGEDKSLLPFGGYNTLTEFQLHKLQKIFKTVYISCKDRSKFNFEANFIEDDITDEIFAPTVGFISVFKTIADECFFAISVDTPFVGEDDIKELIYCDNLNVDATIASLNNKVQPMCGVYHRSLQGKFIEMTQDSNHKLTYLLKSSNTAYINFEDENHFLNLNHPHEYEQALKLI